MKIASLTHIIIYKKGKAKLDPLDSDPLTCFASSASSRCFWNNSL